MRIGKLLGELIKYTECLPCFLAKEASSIPSAVVEGSMNPFPKDSKTYLDSSGSPFHGFT